MTENKRYEVKKQYGHYGVVDTLDYTSIINQIPSIQAKRVADNLNKLHEENQQLKQQNQRWEKICCEGLHINSNLQNQISILEKENKELKKVI